MSTPVCTCQVKHHRHDTGIGVMEETDINMCPLHTAATAMYEALATVPLPKHNEAVGEFYTRFYAWYEGRRKEALAQAEGREG